MNYAKPTAEYDDAKLTILRQALKKAGTFDFTCGPNHFSSCNAYEVDE